MAINFPSSPSNGTTYTYNGVTYVYNSATDQWIVQGTGSSELYVLKTGDTMTGSLTTVGYSGTTGTFSGDLSAAAGTFDGNVTTKNRNSSAATGAGGSILVGSTIPKSGGGDINYGACYVQLDGDATAAQQTDRKAFTASVGTTEKFAVNYDGTTRIGGTLPDSPNITLNANGVLVIGNSTPGNSNATISTQKASGSNVIEVSSDSIEGQTTVFIARGKRSGGAAAQVELGVYKHGDIAEATGYMRMPAGDNARFYWTAPNNNFMCTSSSAQIGTNSGTVVGTQTSDIRLKRNIGDFAKGLAEVKQLEAMSFEYLAQPGVAQAGFIAQQVKDIIPEAVYDTGEPVVGDEDGPTKLAMDYVKIIPALVNAIKELDAKNTALEAQLSQLTTTGGASS